MLGKNFLAKSIDVREIRDSAPVREGKRTPGQAGDAAMRDEEPFKLRRFAGKIKPELPLRDRYQKKRPAVRPGDKPQGARLYLQFLAGGWVIVVMMCALTSSNLAGLAEKEKAADSHPRLRI